MSEKSFMKRVTTAGQSAVAALQAGLRPEPHRSDLPSFQVALPSHGKFYTDRRTHVTVSPFTVAQVGNVHAASRLKDEYAKRAAFAAIVQRSVLDASVYALTDDDYKYLYYWIRINSYKSSPYRLRWAYEHPLELHEVEVDSVVRHTDLDIVELGEHVVFGPDYGYMTLADSLSLLQMGDESEQYVARYAAYISGATLEEKVQRLSTMDASVLPYIKEHMIAAAHGVGEYATLSDPDNPALPPQRVKLVVKIEDFFP